MCDSIRSTDPSILCGCIHVFFSSCLLHMDIQKWFRVWFILRCINVKSRKIPSCTQFICFFLILRYAFRNSVCKQLYFGSGRPKCWAGAKNISQNLKAENTTRMRSLLVSNQPKLLCNQKKQELRLKMMRKWAFFLLNAIIFWENQMFPWNSCVWTTHRYSMELLCRQRRRRQSNVERVWSSLNTDSNHRWMEDKSNTT